MSSKNLNPIQIKKVFPDTKNQLKVNLDSMTNISCFEHTLKQKQINEEAMDNLNKS